MFALVNLKTSSFVFLRFVMPLWSLFQSSNTKLVIERIEDYPLGKPFPPYVVNLTIKGISLKSFDSRLLRLNNLTVLTIENTGLESIPEAIGQLALTLLNLNSNAINGFPGVLVNSALACALRCLNLSFNRITFLPVDFWNLRCLEKLSITGTAHKYFLNYALVTLMQ